MVVFMLNKIAVPLILIVICSTALAAGKDKENKFDGEFWNQGTHFQLTGEAIAIGEDGIHDPTNDSAMASLQQPEEAMADFPRDDFGLLNWVKTLDSGLITPRTDMFGIMDPPTPLDLNITFTNTGAMPNVIFPHRPHTLWLDCLNCHPAIFKQKRGANKFNMTDVFSGRFCGVCHGKVSFSPTRNCMRCHSGPAK